MTKIKSLGLAAAILVAIVLLVGGVKAMQFAAMGNAEGFFAQPPETVSAFSATVQEWPSEYSAIGTVEADEGVTVAAEVPGKVQRLHFKGGENVAMGKVLLEQDASNERAQLSAAKARYNLAVSTYERLQLLRQKNTVSQSELDNALQQMLSAQGDVENVQATLAKKVVRAPFAGRLGLRLVDQGQDLQPGSPIVSLQATKRVRVNLPVPQHWLSKFSSGLAVTVNAGDGSNRQLSGVIAAIGVEIDPATRSALVQSSIDNSAGILIPGMAVATKVTLDKPEQVLVVPSTAIIYAPFGDTVFVVEVSDDAKAATTVRQQFVRLGRAKGDFVEIKDGISEGQQVISAGAFKLMNGQAIVLSDSASLDFQQSPTPADR